MAATWTQIGTGEVKATGLAATDVEPSSSTDGMDIRGLRSFAFTIECDVGQTFLSAAGHFDIFWFDPFVGAWSFVVDAAQQVPPEAATRRRVTFVLDILNRRGRIALIPNGLALSAGGLTAYYAPVNS